MDIVQHSTSENYYFPERGDNKIDYRVLGKDLGVVLTTRDEKKAQRIAEKIGGVIFASR